VGFGGLFATPGGAGEGKAGDAPPVSAAGSSGAAGAASVVAADGKVAADGSAARKPRNKKKNKLRSEEGGGSVSSSAERDLSSSRSLSRPRASGGQGALEPLALADPDPPWSCACGVSCKESARRAHLGSCRLFGRSWKAAFHALAQGVQQQKQAFQQASREGIPGLQAPLSIDQRLAALEKKVAHFAAKQDAASPLPAPASNASAAAGSGSGALAASPGAFAAKRAARWWGRGVLLAALVESGGDVQRAAAKLCQGSGSASGGNRGGGSVLAAEAYRAEMMFVAEAVKLVKLLADHNELLQLTEL
jgi:hypothetical protein